MSEAPGLFTIVVNENSQVVNVHNQIPRQVMMLKRVRVEMDSAADALTAGVIYVSLPFLASNQLVDGNVGYFTLPLVLDNAAVTSYSCDLPLYMSGHVHDQFEVQVYDSTFALLANMVSVTLQMSFNYSHIA